MRVPLPTRYANHELRLGQLDRCIMGYGVDKLEQAIGVIPGKEGGVTLLIKKSDKHHQPATSVQTTTFGPQRSTRKYVHLDTRILSVSWPSQDSIQDQALIMSGLMPPSSTPPPSATTAPISARTPSHVLPLSARARGPSRTTSRRKSGVLRPRLLSRHRG